MNLTRKEFMNSKEKNIFEYIFLFFLILSCNSVYISTNQPFSDILKWMVLISGIILIAWLLFSHYRANKTNVDLKKLCMVGGAFFVLFILFLFFNYSRYHFNLWSAIFTFLLIPFILYLVCFLEFSFKRSEIILRELGEIIILIAALSLFGWIAKEIGIPTNSHMLIDWGGAHSIPGYFFIQFFAQAKVHFIGVNIWRNTSIFTEAPMYAFVLMVGFIINVFFLNKDRHFKMKCLILFVALLTAAASTGILISVLVFLAYLANKYKDVFLSLSRKTRIIIVSILSVLLIGLIFLFLLNKVKSMAGSVSLRSDDLYAGWEAFLSHPLVGNGLGNVAAIQKYMWPYRLIPSGNSGFSSGMFNILGEGGLFFLFFYLVPIIYGFIKQDFKGMLVALIFLVILIFTVVDTVPLLMFMLIFVFVSELFAED